MKITDFAALTFDCYGTLIDWESGIAAELEPWAARNGVSAGRTALLERFARFESAREAEQPVKLYPAVLAAVLRDFGNEFGVAVSDEEAATFGDSVQRWPAFPDSAEALAYLKQHYKLVIVSNVDRASFAHSNAKLGVDFDLIITAEDVGSYKPAPGHFERMLSELPKMGVAKEKILHTAQSLYHDHVPAKGFGLTSIWVNRQAGRAGATKVPDTPVHPDWEVPSMAAMVALHKQHLAG